ncbi:MAG: preprotein translocase subunit SecA [Dehalococcoidia bacterium]|nr:preprotein translocase subunit SecA [Dehalococcoidia bacterium]
MVSFLKKIVGDTPERAAEKLRSQLVPQINRLESTIQNLSDDGLRAKTGEFRRRLDDGASLNDLLPEAFAVVREAARRTLGQRHYDVQIIGGAVLHQGKIAEMKTGEGKTLVATLPAYLNALTGGGVHIVTVNDYLARRDPVWMGPVYDLLGLTVGCLQHDAAHIYDPTMDDPGRGGYRHLTPVSRAEAYRADVLYGTNNEFGFDYLRDNMAVTSDLQVQSRDAGRPCHNFAIVDEVDNILIDEARTPLIISGPAQQPVEHYANCARLAPRLREYEDYTIDERTQAISLTEEGIGKAERHLRVDNLYDPENFHLVQYVENAVVAQVQKVKDKDYVVADGEVVIVDEFTGRLQYGRRWADGLHQAVEAKEGLRVQRESVTYATITLQNYFRMYRKLAGMTGTAVTEADEFYKIYGLEVVAVPTNLPMIRDDSSDLIFPTEEGKWRAVIDAIIDRSTAGQPVLVGTTSIETSEVLSDRLRKRGVEHQVLNARNHEQEASIVAQAGRSGAVTVSTNMAGRGTDIVLGGADTDRDDWRQEHDQVISLGGLHVIGTEHHEARRVDNQLRGRAGRQGDPGSSQFFIALEDELMQRFGGDRIKNVMNWTGLNDDEPLENKLITKSITSAQVKVEGHHFDMRKHLLNFDDVLNQQRSVIYDQRSNILTNQGLRERVVDMLGAEFDRLMDAHLQSRHADDWDIDGFLSGLRQICPPPTELDNADKVSQLRRDHIEDILEAYSETLYQSKEQSMGAENMETLVRLLLLKSIDTHWVNHLTHMENLRTGVGLQAVGQRDPLTVYRSEGQRAFTELTRQMQRDVTHTLFHVTLAPEAPPARSSPNDDASTSGSRRNSRAPVSPMEAVSPARNAAAPRAGRKIGRNSKCPCGSDKKYKRCCGAAA